MNYQEPPMLLFNLEQNTKNALLQPGVGMYQLMELSKAQLVAVLLMNKQPVNLNSGKPALSQSILNLVQTRGVREITDAQLLQLAQGVQQPLPALVQPQPVPAAQPVAAIQVQPADQVVPLQDDNAPVLPDCIVCMEDPFQCVFSRCGHLCICRRCKDTLYRNPQAALGLPVPAELPSANCPVCREIHRKQEVLNIYLP